MKWIQPLINTVQQRQEVEQLKLRRRKEDWRVRKLTKATINGDEEWMLKMVRKNPTCALKVIQECGDDEEH